MNINLKEAMDHAVAVDPDGRDNLLHANQQEKTMLSPILSETELSSQKATPPEASSKNDALRPLLS